jgi:hypothetical protein
MFPLFANAVSGMEWLPLALLGMGGGLLVGAIGTLVGLAVSRSRFAFWAGAFACAIGIAAPVFFLAVAGRYLSLTAFPLLAVPLVTGLPAVLLSFRDPVRWLGEATSPGNGLKGPAAWLSKRPLWVTLVLAGVVGALAWGCVSWVRPLEEFDRLLDGDGGVAVRSVVITGQGLTAELADPESARYFTALFRSARARANGLSSGTTYTAWVRLESGGTVEVTLYVPEEEGWLSFGWTKDPWGLHDDSAYYRVRLPEPVPAPVAEVLRRLR